MEVLKGVLFAIETEQKKTEFNIPLDHNAPCLSQRDDQRSRKKTYRLERIVAQLQMMAGQLNHLAYKIF